MSNPDPLSAFLAWAKEEPEAPFITYLNSESVLQTITLRETVDRIVEVRDTILAPNIRSENVGLLFGVEPDCYAAFLGCLAAGKTAVFLSPSWSPAVLSAITARLDISMLLYSTLSPPTSLSSEVRTLHLPTTSPANGQFADFPAFNLSLVPELALINHTSGTTGIPKSCPCSTLTLASHLPVNHFPQNATGAVISPPTFSLTIMILSRTPYFHLRLHFPPQHSPASPPLSPGQQVQTTIASALHNKITLFWLPPALLTSTLATLSPTKFPFVQNIILGGEAVTNAHLQAIHASCPHATILPWFGATEISGAICASRIPALQMARGEFPARVGFDTFYSIQKVVLLDPEDGTMAVSRRERQRGRFAILPSREAAVSVTFLGASEEVRNDTFGKWEGKTMVIYGDVAEYVGNEAQRIVVLGRVGRDVKINGVYVNLDFFDAFVGEKELVGAGKRTHTVWIQGLICLFVEGELGGEAEAEGVLGVINGALVKNGTSAKIAAVFGVLEWPKVPSGKIDGKVLEVLAAKLLEDRGTGEEISEENTLARELSALAVEILKLDDGFRGKDFKFARVGMDSIRAVSLISAVSKRWNVLLRPEAVLGVGDSPTTLADIVRNGGKRVGSDVGVLMAKEVDDFHSNLESVAAKPLVVDPKTIFVTGATGFLGTFTLHALLRRHPSARILVLARGSSDKDARSRVLASLKKAQLSLTPQDEDRIQVLPGDLALSSLGLRDSHFALLRTADLIAHVGAEVHWTRPYSSLRSANVVSTQQLLETGIPMIFVTGGGDDNGDDGYTVSKSVAQALVLEAAQVAGMKVRVVKPGFILGDSMNGVANTDDFIWRLVKTVIALGFADVDSEDLRFSAAFVDDVATEVVGAFERLEAVRVVAGSSSFGEVWKTLEEVGYSIQRVGSEKWLEAFERELEEKGNEQPLVSVKHLMLGDQPSLKGFGATDYAKTESIRNAGLVRNVRGLIEAGFLPDPVNGSTGVNIGAFGRRNK